MKKIFFIIFISITKTFSFFTNSTLHPIEYSIIPCQKLEKLKFGEEIIFNKIELTHGIIQSPNYPNKYPKSEQCVYSIHAPKNHNIILKYAEKFSLEPSHRCSHDFIEIRDGQFGYSPLIDKYCELNQPKFPIESTGRDLWIKFNSDESIQSDGFKIFYEFKYVPVHSYLEQLSNLKLFNDVLRCEIIISPYDFMVNASGVLTSNEVENYFNKKYDELNKILMENQKTYNLKRILDCTVQIEVEKDHKIFLAFESINITLAKNTSTPKDSHHEKRRKNCTDNFIQLYDGSTSIVNKKLHICSSEINKFYKSQTNKIFLRINLNKHSDRDIFMFKLVYNPFTTGPCTTNGLFQCSDNTCINKNLVCDGRRNCNFSDDETDCIQLKIGATRKNSKKWTLEQKTVIIHQIIIIILGVVLSLIIIAAITISCKRSIQLNLKRKKEFQLMNLYEPTKTETK